jgi:hypothetical protein
LIWFVVVQEVTKNKKGTQEKVGLIPCEVGCGPGTYTYKKHRQIERGFERARQRNRRKGPCYGGMRANPDGSCDICHLRK